MLFSVNGGTATEDPKNRNHDNAPKPQDEELSRELGKEELDEVAGGTTSGEALHHHLHLDS